MNFLCISGKESFITLPQMSPPPHRRRVPFRDFSGSHNLPLKSLRSQCSLRLLQSVARSALCKQSRSIAPIIIFILNISHKSKMSSEKYISDAFFGCGERFYGDLRKKLHKYIFFYKFLLYIEFFCIIIENRWF